MIGTGQPGHVDHDLRAGGREGHGGEDEDQVARADPRDDVGEDAWLDGDGGAHDRGFYRLGCLRRVAPGVEPLRAGRSPSPSPGSIETRSAASGWKVGLAV